jgi:hypothetical protein
MSTYAEREAASDFAKMDAMQQMLRDFVSDDPAAIGGMGRIKCLTPVKYQTDCGQCVVCCAGYTNGALVWAEKSHMEKREALALFREATAEMSKFREAGTKSLYDPTRR